jgi:hypothetical protein
MMPATMHPLHAQQPFELVPRPSELRFGELDNSILTMFIQNGRSA